MMKRLFLDTSNKFLYIAILEDEKVIYTHLQEGNNNHSETLVGVLDNCFKEANIQIDEIAQIYVGRGPGSYTGVRVACTVAKVLAYAKNIKLYSFSSLDLLLTTNLKEGIVLSKMDARRGFSYAKAFNIDTKVNVIMDESYIETEKINAEYANATIVTADDSCYDPTLILKYNLYKEIDDIHNFVPTYLRSGV